MKNADDEITTISRPLTCEECSRHKFHRSVELTFDSSLLTFVGTSLITGGLLEDNLVLPHHLDNRVILISFNYNRFSDFKHFSG